MALLRRLLPGMEDKLPSLVVRRPTLLIRSPRAVARDIRQLAVTLGLTDWAAARLVAGGPGILELSLVTLARRLARLKELCSQHPKWEQQLTAMSPSSLGRCLRCSDMALERLALLLAAKAAGSRRVPKVKRILTLPAPLFDGRLQRLGLDDGGAAGTAKAGGRDSQVEGRDSSAGSDSDDDGDDAGLLWPRPEMQPGAAAAVPPTIDSKGGGGSGADIAENVARNDSILQAAVPAAV